MEKIVLKATKRTILGRQVKKLRQNGLIPAHIFGKGVENESISVKAIDFEKAFRQAGETGLIELKIDEEKVRPVLVRGVQYDPVKERPIHIDFYQVNLLEKVKASVPIVLVGEEIEAVHAGDAVVIQPMMEVEVEALPTDLPEKIEVSTDNLRQIDDVILVSQLPVPAGVEILADPEAVVAKLDKAVTEEMEKILEEQAAEQAAVAEVTTPAEGEAASIEGEEQLAEGEESSEDEAPQENTGSEQPA